MKIHDISLTISEDMVVYKDRPEKKPKIIVTRTLKEGSNESKLYIESHTGTHVDAPYHMIGGGKRIDDLNLGIFLGNCVVMDFTKIKNSITKEHLEKNKTKIKKNDIVLLKTKNKHEDKFDHSFTYLDRSGALYLASKQIKAVGIDSLGIERDQPEHDTHIVLLREGIAVIEGIELSKIEQGRYFFIGLPLKIRGADASPIRAVLIEGI